MEGGDGVLFSSGEFQRRLRRQARWQQPSNIVASSPFLLFFFFRLQSPASGMQSERRRLTDSLVFFFLFFFRRQDLVIGTTIRTGYESLAGKRPPFPLFFFLIIIHTTPSRAPWRWCRVPVFFFFSLFSL